MTEETKPDSSKEQENNNMDWKKNGFDKRERLTLKVNLEEAIRRKSNDRIDKQSRSKLKAKPTKNKPYRKNKIKSSIYDDEDEEEEDYILLPVFNNLPRFSLEKALTPKEKKQLDQLEKNQEQRMSAPEKIQIEQQNQPNTVETKHINKIPENKYPPKDERFGYIELAKIEVKTEESPLHQPAKDKNKAPRKIEKELDKEEIISAINDINSKLLQKDNQQKVEEKKDPRSVILEKSGRKDHSAKQNKEEKKTPANQKTAQKQKEYEKTNER